MGKMGEMYQTADWKSEKHVPVIECPDTVQAGEIFNVTLSLGKEVAHPNTVEHHIRWIRLFFKPDDDKFVYHVGSYEFAAHGESVAGADQGPVHCHHAAVAGMQIKKSGALLATAYCNIHGLWENAKPIKVA
ncbi:class II SORL domain-containing protein [Desulfatitalea alkaliphila]|uniref:Class II SORL domain-containing protein n=1 Tax=Desulfatitalea alkaliphila TaxID=2929485 RepID=A0AA41QZ01_9BACT|nr:class II SORL domain-containing protein [Desulfatitalea alkaliphila]MCJ8499012.1 class II SORL domain-containing protein [Desulfatitalea alkaliphila]